MRKKVQLVGRRVQMSSRSELQVIYRVQAQSSRQSRCIPLELSYRCLKAIFRSKTISSGVCVVFEKRCREV
ncbi:MAG: hypothetical protein EZS28_049410 [Streblomastix strix]|uniref:Uncharacterized protein n=1 Tax=Streblomastix strix TaxID=222440 RepID=A0A5J4TB37_9EUKA|nr:MAG: hypothetical protein EZS28_049410 [Streblomastix strix]